MFAICIKEIYFMCEYALPLNWHRDIWIPPRVSSIIPAAASDIPFSWDTVALITGYSGDAS